MPFVPFQDHSRVERDKKLKFLYGSGMQTFSVRTGGIKEDLFDNLWTVIEGNKVSFLVSDLLSVLQAKEKVYNETRP